MDADNAEGAVAGVHVAVPRVSRDHHGVTSCGFDGLVTNREAALALSDHER